MKRLLMLSALIFGMMVGAFAEDRPIVLVTPSGVWQSIVTGGVPGPFVAMPYDVIVQGSGPSASPPVPPVVTPPVTPPGDAVVQQIKTLSLALKDQREATAVAALVNSLSKMGLTGANFKQALEMAAPIADTSMQTGGRIAKWAKSATAITTDPVKLIAGLNAAYTVSPATLDTIHQAAQAEPGAAVSGEALDWAQIIQIIQMVLELLKGLGIIPSA